MRPNKIIQELIAYNITNHPITEALRWVSCINFNDDRANKIITTTYKVYSFNSEEVSLDAYIAPKIVELKATMENFVDSQGNYLPEQTENSYPEYSFWKNMIASGVIEEETLYQQVISKADLLNRFD